VELGYVIENRPWRDKLTLFAYFVQSDFPETQSPAYKNFEVPVYKIPKSRHTMPQPQRQRYNTTQLKCTVHGCQRWFRNQSGRTKHFRSYHGPQAAMHSHSHHLPSNSSRDDMDMHVDDASLVDRTDGSSHQESDYQDSPHLLAEFSLRVSHLSTPLAGYPPPLYLASDDAPMPHPDKQPPSQESQGTSLPGSHSSTPSYSPCSHLWSLSPKPAAP
jgi:hypothetical protein